MVSIFSKNGHSINNHIMMVFQVDSVRLFLVTFFKNVESGMTFWKQRLNENYNRQIYKYSITSFYRAGLISINSHHPTKVVVPHSDRGTLVPQSFKIWSTLVFVHFQTLKLQLPCLGEVGLELKTQQMMILMIKTKTFWEWNILNK